MVTTPGQTRAERLLTSLMNMHLQVGYVLCGLAAVLGLVFILVGFQADDASRLGFTLDWEYWPEAVGAGCLAIVALGAGLWLTVTPPEQINLAAMRIVVLAAGGLAGLIIFLATLGRAGRWWSDIFSEGLEGWQGPGWWKFWLCVAVGLFGLVLMFVSLLLARSEERTNAVLRRLLYGYNAALCGVLVLAILIIANVMVHYLWPSAYKWTQTRGMYTLSQQSRNILSSIKEPIYAYVIMSERNRLFEDVRTLLDNCQAVTGKITVRTISPELRPEEIEDLMNRFPSLIGVEMDRRRGIPRPVVERGIALVKGEPKSKGESLIAFIPLNRLFEVENDPRASGEESSQTLLFKGEDALMSELKYWMEGGKAPKIYFTQDNEEPRLDKGFLSLLKNNLERSKYQVVGLRLRKPQRGSKSDKNTVIAVDVPKDADVVIIAQPAQPFSDDAKAALRRYMDKDGKLFVLFDFDLRNLQAPTGGLEKLLADYNVEMRKAFLVRQDPVAPFTIRVQAPEESTNKLARAMSGKMLAFTFVRPLRKLSSSRKYQVDPVLEAREDQEFWIEADLKRMRQPEAVPFLQLRERKQSSKEPVPVALAVTEQASDKPRLVACGNVRFAFLTSNDPVYYDFFVNCLQWLRGHANTLGEQPQKSNRFTLNAAGLNADRMKFLPAWLIGISIVGLGVGMWVVRRR